MALPNDCSQADPKLRLSWHASTIFRGNETRLKHYKCTFNSGLITCVEQGHLALVWLKGTLPCALSLSTPLALCQTRATTRPKWSSHVEPRQFVFLYLITFHVLTERSEIFIDCGRNSFRPDTVVRKWLLTRTSFLASQILFEKVLMSLEGS